MAPPKVQTVQRKLMRWYNTNHRKLPWRETGDPYCIWVSEVMLQQTQVKTALPYYQKFIKRYPTLSHLARADQQEVLKNWEGLGYYARARNLHRAAGLVLADHGGKVPCDWDEFIALPGVGDYIASAVQSIAFNESEAVVDGNVKRLYSRLLAIETPVNASRAHKSYKAFARRYLLTSDPGNFNQAVMELGALVCTPRNPRCDQCPLKTDCLAKQTNSVSELPKRNQSKPVPVYKIATGVVRRRGKILITKRKPEGLLGGLWEFPGGKRQPGESAAEACIREIREETGLEVEVESQLTSVKHTYSHFKITMDVFLCRSQSGPVKLGGPVAFRWIRTSEITDFPFPGANHKFIPLLLK
jgi:A/G-specific adenine glycosylase